MADYFSEYATFVGSKGLPSPVDTPYETPGYIRSKRSSRATATSSREQSASPPPLPPDAIDFTDKSRDGRYSALDPRRFTPTLHASLVSEILNLRRELDSKNNLVENLETHLADAKTETETLLEQVSEQQKEARKAEQHVQLMETGTYEAIEELVKERDLARHNAEDLRGKLDTAAKKARRQDEDALRAQGMWEQEKESWDNERRQFERRIHVTENRLRMFVDEVAAQQAIADAQGPLLEDMGDVSTFKDSGLGNESDSASIKSVKPVNHKRNRSSMSFVARSLRNSASTRASVGTLDTSAKPNGYTLADELGIDEEDEYDLDEFEHADDELEYPEVKRRTIDLQRSSGQVDADSKAKRVLGLTTQESQSLDLTPTKAPAMHGLLRRISALSANVAASQGQKDLRSLPLRAIPLGRPVLAPARQQHENAPDGPLNRASQYGVTRPIQSNSSLGDIEKDSDASENEEAVSDADPRALLGSIPAFSKAPHGRFALSGPPKVVPEDKEISPDRPTMVGEWMWKYVRKRKSFGIAENTNDFPHESSNGAVSVTGHGTRHKRWVWLSPYERTIMWDSKQPTSGSALMGKKGRKLTIQSVLDVQDNTPLPKGAELSTAFNRSILILTPQRALKFTTISHTRHELWMNALSFLAQSGRLPAQFPAIPPIPSRPTPPIPTEKPLSATRQRSPSFGRATIRDSVRLAKGRRPETLRSLTQPIGSSSSSRPTTDMYPPADPRDSADTGADFPSIPRLYITTSKHQRKRSNTSPRLPAPLSTLRSFSSHAAVPSSSANSSSRLHPLSITASSSAGAARTSSSKSGSRRDSSIASPVLANFGSEGVAAAVGVVGTVRMEAFVDPSVRDGVLYVPAPPPAIPSSVGLSAGLSGQRQGHGQGQGQGGWRRRGDSNLSQSTVDKRRAGYVFDENGLDPFKGF
ncbi:hypothetical protein B0A54_11221 [Friedmanniomyces endolithicus]|uniref:Pleckstrin homology domain-containing protein n=1 Tax=Friedmanniomyces endolithicus TaxID=329885 RepID=A0A4U0UQC3_9PEZI|nr:hypothetical protein B0A54_11221 [Friedmanniomyces endolithicus]